MTRGEVHGSEICDIACVGYRCYITDLDLSGLLDDGHGQSILFLRHKAELEKALNEEMERQ